jgi:DNA modification methylase
MFFRRMATKMAKAKSKMENVVRLNADAKATVACQDNLKFMRGLDDETIDLIVTSPPYNIGKEYETKKSQARYIEEQAACVAGVLVNRTRQEIPNVDHGEIERKSVAVVLEAAKVLLG